MTVTFPETSTVTPAQTKPIGSTKGEKEHKNPKVTPTPTRDRQTPVTDTSSKAGPTFKPFQSLNSIGIPNYKTPQMAQVSLNDIQGQLGTINEDMPWEAKSTDKDSITLPNDVKLPLNPKMDNFVHTPSTKSKITPYPGYQLFGKWLESQFPTIPIGISMLLHSLDIKTECDIDYWVSLTAKDYVTILGKEVYENVRVALAEVRNVRRYIHHQWDNDKNDPKNWTYLDYLAFRNYYIAQDKNRFSKYPKDQDSDVLSQSQKSIPYSSEEKSQSHTSHIDATTNQSGYEESLVHLYHHKLWG